MKKEEFENIIKEQSNLKNLPNQKLVEFMDLLSSDFESTKESIINSTRYLDKVEELYNNTLKVYQERNNHE
jgi:flagellar motor switch protein FliG